jgi:hypothetical protein
MAGRISFPVKKINSEDWVEISAHAPSQTHYICAEKVHQQGDMSFAGGHRVRLFAMKKSIHVKMPDGIDLNISGVDAPAAPRRR